MLIVTSLAIWKGDGPEKSVAVVILVMFLAGRIYPAWTGVGITLVSVDYFSAALDAVVAVALVAIALYANRMYTLWIAGLQIIAVSAHLARGVIDAMTPIAYVILFVLPSYFQIIALGMGLLAHRRRLKAYGPYKAWRNSGNHISAQGRSSL